MVAAASTALDAFEQVVRQCNAKASALAEGNTNLARCCFRAASAPSTDDDGRAAQREGAEGAIAGARRRSRRGPELQRKERARGAPARRGPQAGSPAVAQAGSPAVVERLPVPRAAFEWRRDHERARAQGRAEGPGLLDGRLRRKGRARRAVSEGRRRPAAAPRARRRRRRPGPPPHEHGAHGPRVPGADHRRHALAARRPAGLREHLARRRASSVPRLARDPSPHAARSTTSASSATRA